MIITNWWQETINFGWFPSSKSFRKQANISHLSYLIKTFESQLLVNFEEIRMRSKRFNSHDTKYINKHKVVDTLLSDLMFVLNYSVCSAFMVFHNINGNMLRFDKF